MYCIERLNKMREKILGNWIKFCQKWDNNKGRKEDIQDYVNFVLKFQQIRISQPFSETFKIYRQTKIIDNHYEVNSQNWEQICYNHCLRYPPIEASKLLQ